MKRGLGGRHRVSEILGGGRIRRGRPRRCEDSGGAPAHLVLVVDELLQHERSGQSLHLAAVLALADFAQRVRDVLEERGRVSNFRGQSWMRSVEGWGGGELPRPRSRARTLRSLRSALLPLFDAASSFAPSSSAIAAYSTVFCSPSTSMAPWMNAPGSVRLLTCALSELERPLLGERRAETRLVHALATRRAV